MSKSRIEVPNWVSTKRWGRSVQILIADLGGRWGAGELPIVHVRGEIDDAARPVFRCASSMPLLYLVIVPLHPWVSTGTIDEGAQSGSPFQPLRAPALHNP